MTDKIKFLEGITFQQLISIVAPLWPIDLKFTSPQRLISVVNSFRNVNQNMFKVTVDLL